MLNGNRIVRKQKTVHLKTELFEIELIYHLTVCNKMTDV